jgi:GT2 family glycosyltransferase
MNQLPQKASHIRVEPRVLCFIAILIPREVWQLVGELDERFTHYGCEDDDYCRRATLEGVRLGIWDQCLVGHDGRSSFRSGNAAQENSKQLALNRQIYRKKWGTDR